MTASLISPASGGSGVGPVDGAEAITSGTMSFAAVHGASQRATPPDRWIVRLRPSATSGAEESAARTIGATVRHAFSRAGQGFAVTADASQAAALARRSDVLSVEPDHPVSASDTQESPPWGLDRIDQRTLPLSSSYSWTTTGSGVTAYIVDTGIRATHVEFAGRVAAGFTAISDGNGTSDCMGHGTHVAGTVGGTTYGVAKQVTLVAVRVLDCTGSGLDSDVIAGLDWVISHHAAGERAVVNLSLGGPPSNALDAAVNATIADGVTVVVAAGNDSVDACTQSPARVPGALTVAASTSTDSQATFSNFGSCVDVYAPGVSVTSAYFTSDTAVAVGSGTSMSAPHVAGLTARLLSASPLTPSQVVTSVTASSTATLTGLGTGSPNRLLFNDPTVALSGVVRSATGIPVPGVVVAVTRASGAQDSSTTTDANGLYSLRVTTGPLRLSLGQGPTQPADLPPTWSVPLGPFTSVNDRIVDVGLPATASVTVQVYAVDGSPVAGVVIHESGSYSGSPYTASTGFAVVTPSASLGAATTDVSGRAVLRGFSGTAATVFADDTSSGGLVRATISGLRVTDGLALAVPDGGTTTHTPTFVMTDGTVGGLLAAVIAAMPDVVTVPVGKVGPSTRAFGCVIPHPADADQASAAMLGNGYTDVAGVTRPSPDGLCRILTVSVGG